MLKYYAIGPDSKGKYITAHTNEGTSFFTIIKEYDTLEQAQDLADHYNLIESRRHHMTVREKNFRIGLSQKLKEAVS